MEQTLNQLISSLESTVSQLKGPYRTELENALHDHDKLPDKKLSELATRAGNLLHEVEQMLEPGPLVLADHFLGNFNLFE
jgi:hypothetical protein